MTLHTTVARAHDRLRASLWAIPGSMILAAALAALGTVALDRRFVSGAARPWWVFQAGVAGARATLSAIATSVMTVAGIAFSITVVVLQLASSQFSPRVVRNFMRDRLIQVVLGAYMATFTYALLVLRSVTSDEVHGAAFVAPTGVSAAIALALVCMVLLVVFVHHVARSVQVSSIIDAIARETREAIDRLYPQEIADPLGAPGAEHTPGGDAPGRSPQPPRPRASPRAVHAPTSGYLDLVDERAFAALPPDTVAEVVVMVGDYVHTGDALAHVWLPDGADEEAACRRLHRAFALESERTVQQDARFGVRMIADVALRAVSPGINDPTTACYCVNVLGELLCQLASREWPEPVRRIAEQRVTMRVAQPQFDDVVELAFGQVLQYGRDDVRVVGAVAAALGAIAARSRRPDVAEPVRALADRVARTAASAPWPDEARARVLGALRRDVAPGAA